MTESKKLFCSKPFRWFDVAPGEGIGNVYLCCPWWLDTPAGNLQRQSVEEIWNGETAQEIRASILDGSFRYCNKSRCPALQNVVYPVQYVEDVTDEELKAVIADGLTVLPYGPRDLNCSYDLSCNLSCPSCRTQLIVESTNREQLDAIRERLDAEALQSVEWLYITGSGDPFGSPHFRHWLRNMRRERMPRLKGIHLYTNGLLWTPEMWDSIPAEIREMILSTHVSIDAAEPETYALNRRGGSFDRLLESLGYISSLRADGPLQSMCISMVVQANNFEEMPKFVDLGRRFHTDRVFFSKLINWGAYSEEEYLDRAVHLPGHPRHAEFLDLIRGEVFDHELVDLGNLLELRRPRAPHGAEQFPALTKELVNREAVFKAPPMTEELVRAIKLIAPQFKLTPDEASRRFWEADQNGACWGEYEALEPVLKNIPRPAKVLEVGPGLGRSVVFFARKLPWQDAEFHLYEGNGDRTKYTLLGPRFDDSFCGNTSLLEQVLDFNGVSNFKVFDAAALGFELGALPGPYDVIYSFYSIGYHWSLEHFFDDIVGLMHETSVAFFTVPNEFEPFEKLGGVHFKTVTWKAAWPADRTLRILIMSKSELPEATPAAPKTQ